MGLAVERMALFLLCPHAIARLPARHRSAARTPSLGCLPCIA